MLSRRSLFKAAAVALAAPGFTLALPEALPAQVVVPKIQVPVVWGAGQCGSSLLTKGWGSRPPCHFEEIRIAAFMCLNPDRATRPFPRRCLVTYVHSRMDDIFALGIWPPIITAGQYQNVVEAPANGSQIELLPWGPMPPDPLAWVRAGE